MRGDLREISVLNKYIGVRIPEHLPQLRWLPVALLAAARLWGWLFSLCPVLSAPAALFVIAALLSRGDADLRGDGPVANAPDRA